MKLSISKNCHEILFILRSFFIYFFRSQRSQSQLRINYHSEQVTSNKLYPFQWISSGGKFGTIAQSIHSGGTHAKWTGTHATNDVSHGNTEALERKKKIVYNIFYINSLHSCILTGVH